jgi:hypothetical protein
MKKSLLVFASAIALLSSNNLYAQDYPGAYPSIFYSGGNLVLNPTGISAKPGAEKIYNLDFQSEYQVVKNKEDGAVLYRVEKKDGKMASLYRNSYEGESLFRFDDSGKLSSATDCSVSLSDKTILGGALGVRDGSSFCRTVTKSSCDKALKAMDPYFQNWSETARITQECVNHFNQMKKVFNQEDYIKLAKSDRDYVESQHKGKGFISLDIYKVGEQNGPLIDANEQNPMLSAFLFTAMCAKHFPAVSPSTRGFGNEIFKKKPDNIIQRQKAK